jgi:Tol biopolymer transport system component
MAGLAWTNDGGSLVYGASNALNHYSILRIPARGKAEPKVLDVAAGGSFPAVALKGGRLVYSRGTWDLDIWSLRDGNKPEPFLVSSTDDRSAQFSADGRRIAFASARSGESIAIWVANADGSGPAPLTRGSDVDQGSPRWSPDGKWIAFDARGKEGRWNIEIIQSSGGTARQLTSGPFNSSVPSWSRDGKWIYFGSNRTGRFEVWRIPSQGGPAEQITHDGGHVPLESPDGETLYYTKTNGDGPLFSRPLRGGAEKQILERVVRRGFAVFEDGVYYLYSDPATPEVAEVRFYQLRSGRSRVISPIDGRRLDLYLSVSPDRRTLLFTRGASAGSDLMLIENFR